MDLRNSFIRIKNERHSREFQEYVSKLGIKWVHSSRVACLGARILIVGDDLTLTYAESEEDFVGSYEEIFFDFGVIISADGHIVGADKMVDFSGARVGDKVWHYRFGDVVIDDVDFDRGKYPLFIMVDCDNDDWYTIDGKLHEDDINPSVFHSEPKIIAPPKPVRMKRINGHEIPDITFTPKDMDDYYYPSLDNVFYGATTYMIKGHWDNWNVKNGMCYPYTEQGKQAAIAHAKALLDYKED